MASRATPEAPAAAADATPRATSSSSPSSATSRSSRAPGAGSPTSRSRSRSSRSSPGRSPTFAVRVAERRPDRGLDRLAGALRLRAHGRLLDGRADLEVPDRRRPLLVGARARRHGLELDDRLVQHRRPGRDRRLGRLRRGVLPQRACSASTGVDIFGVNFGDDVAHPRRDVRLLFLLILGPLHAGQHLRRPRPGAAQQHLGRLARARRRGDHRAAGLRPRRPPERRASSSASGSTTPASTTARPAASASGSSCCRSASC